MRQQFLGIGGELACRQDKCTNKTIQMIVPKQTHQSSKCFCFPGHNHSWAPNETSLGWRRDSQSKVKHWISFRLRIPLPAVTIPSGVTASGLETASPASLATTFFSVYIYPNRQTQLDSLPLPILPPCAAPCPAPTLPGPAQAPPPSCPLSSLFWQK